MKKPQNWSKNEFLEYAKKAVCSIPRKNLFHVGNFFLSKDLKNISAIKESWFSRWFNNAVKEGLFPKVEYLGNSNFLGFHYCGGRYVGGVKLYKFTGVKKVNFGTSKNIDIQAHLDISKI
jgi:hypothetical protein